MSEFKIAQENGRTIPKEDKIFGINARAKAAIAKEGKLSVVNATAGTLMDESGHYMIMPTIGKIMGNLRPEDFAEYAPIGGIPEFRKAIIKAAFGSYEPKAVTCAVGTPGGTGSISLAISNYSKAGDAILTTDWYWANYKGIAAERGRTLETFTYLTDEYTFNAEAFEEALDKLLAKQDSLLILINTPAHNPTGYSMSLEDWNKAIEIMTRQAEAGKQINLYVDTAYMDFAGDDEEVRRFLPLLDEVRDKLFIMIGFSASKTFTLYGQRCGALICMAPDQEIADEFKRCCEFTARSSWSNSPRSPQVAIAAIYSDDNIYREVENDRNKCKKILLSRGEAFSKAAEEAGLDIVPYMGGFFSAVPCRNSAAICSLLEAQNIFAVPLEKGIRFSLASISEDIAAQLPAKIKAVMDEAELD